MKNKYTPISERENIRDKDVAKILDYLERHAKTFEQIARNHQYRIDGLRFDFLEGYCSVRDDLYRKFISLPTKILSENIAGIY